MCHVDAQGWVTRCPKGLCPQCGFQFIGSKIRRARICASCRRASRNRKLVMTMRPMQFPGGQR